MTGRHPSKSSRSLRIQTRPYLLLSLFGLLSLPLVGSSPLQALDDGEIVITVEDEDGAPIAGVEVVVTSSGDEKFHKETKTNKKGRLALRVFDATLPYIARFSKEGFVTTEAPLEFKVGGKVRLTVPMSRVGSAPPAVAPNEPAGTPEEVVRLFNEGVQASQNGDRILAEKRLKEALELAPDLIQAHAALTILYFESDRHAEASEEVEVWLAKDPGNGTALRIRYEVQKAMGDEKGIEEARVALEKASPEVLADSLVEEGRKLFNDGDRAGARELLEQALTRNPDAARGHYLLGLCDLSEENPEEARGHLERFLELAPDDPEAATARELLGMLR